MAAKNKNMNYLLIALVAIVWGLIFYKVFLYLTFEEEEVLSTPPAPLKKSSADDYSRVADTTALNLNYRDPFSAGRAARDTLIKRNDRTRAERMSNTMLTPAVNWDFIQYEGFIQSPDTKQLIALVRINGKSLMLSQGESGGQVHLVRNMKDSIKVSFNGKTTIIHLKKT